MKFKIFLLFTSFSLLLFWPIFLGKVNLNGNLLVSFYAPYGQNLPFKNSGWDQLRIYFPFYKVTLDSLKTGMIPVWNPYAFSGHPHMADFQTAVFYPLNLLGLFLPQIEFWHLLRITPAILGAFFTFLYLRSLGLVSLAAVFGALTFGLSPFILTWGEEVVMSPHSIVWLPLILFGIERFLGTKKKIFLAVISLSSAFSFFGGYMQTSIYMFIFIFAYLIFRAGKELIFGRRGWLLLLAFILGVGIAAVQLAPSAELFFNAARSEVTLREQLVNFLLPVESILTYLAPDFFGHPATGNFFRRGDAQYYEGILFVGVAALVFAFYMVLVEGRRWRVKFLAISAVVSLSMTIDWFGAKAFLSLPIPFLSTSIPNRVLFIPAFCLAILAAGGMDRWIGQKLETRNEKLEIFKAVLAVAGVYAGILVTLLWVKIFGFSYFEHKQFLSEANWLVSARNLAVPAVVFGMVAGLFITAWVKRLGKQTAAMVIILVSLLHIFYFSQKYFSFSERVNVFPETDVLKFIRENQSHFRSWGVGEARFENNFASQYGIYWPEGYDSLNNRSYGEFTYAMQGADIEQFIFRADAGLGHGSGAELLGNPDRRKLVDLVGVRYVIGKSNEEQVMSQYGFKKVFEDGQYAVFENLTVMPRAFLASNYEGPPDVFGEEPKSEEEKAARDQKRRKLIPQKLLSSDFDFRNVLVLEKPSPISAQFGEGTAEIVSYGPQEVVVRTKSDQPKLLFLSDNWYPGWKTSVDGDETEILRANYTFRAVPLTPGEHEVRFWYASGVLGAGAAISVVSLAALLVLVFGRKKLLSV